MISHRRINIMLFSFKAVFDISWDGWNDTDSGLKSYHFEVFHLRQTGFDIESELTHGDKVTEGVPEESSPDSNTVRIKHNFSLLNRVLWYLR